MMWQDEVKMNMNMNTGLGYDRAWLQQSLMQLVNMLNAVGIVDIGRCEGRHCNKHVSRLLRI